MSEFRYRPDVDGLRAVAVMLVLLFHAGLGFSGGYVGVDVFFVISGFLITGLILKEQNAGTFSLGNFWMRRIRRIIPAATFMVISVLVVGFFLILPNDYKELGESSIAQQLMFSNVYFWRNTGYFDGAAEIKPLLHTWSLAVEEQFYIGYPFLLILLHRFGKKTTFWALFLLGLGSLGISEYGVRNHPSATFFLLPTRAWELMIGGLICFLPLPTRVPRWVLGLASWISLVAILWAGWFYQTSTPFPGFSALIPCAATAILIYANSLSLSFPAALLASRPFVFVGLISYSLYLWHWPILALYRYANEESLSVLTGILLLSTAFFAAVLSWRYIETPFRRRGHLWSRQQTFAFATAAGVAVLLFSGAIAWQKGLIWRFPPEVVRFAEYEHSKKFLYVVGVNQAAKGEFPIYGNTKASQSCVLWGDSHAMALAPGLDKACLEKGVRVLQATRSQTPPMLNLMILTEVGLNKIAPKFNSEVLSFIQRNQVNYAILSGVWRNYAKYENFESDLRSTIRQLTDVGVKVAIVLDVADHKLNVPRLFAKQAWNGGSLVAYRGVSLDLHRQQNAVADEIIYRVCDEFPLASVLDPAEFFVDADNYWQACINGELMYRDRHHLSVEGGLRLKGMFLQFLEQTGKSE